MPRRCMDFDDIALRKHAIDIVACDSDEERLAVLTVRAFDLPYRTVIAQLNAPAICTGRIEKATHQ